MEDDVKDPNDWRVVANSPFADQFRPPPGLENKTVVRQQSPVSNQHMVDRIEFLLNEAMGAVNVGDDPSEYILQAIGYLHDLSSN
jgi:hypothetical protein